MKRKLLILLTALTLLFAFAGCSADGQAYWAANKKVQDWPAYSQKGTGSFALDAMGEKVQMDFSTESYYNTKDMTGTVKVHFNSSDPEFKLPDMDMYLDKGMAYINKSYFTSVFSMNGEKVPEKLAKLNADYIALDYSIPTIGSALAPMTTTGSAVAPDMSKLMKKLADPSQRDALTKTLADVFKDVNIPVEKTDETYTIKMDSDQMLNAGVQAVEAFVKGLPTLSKELDLNIPKKDMDQLMTSYDSIKKDIPDKLKEVKESIKGSNFELKTTFAEDKVEQNLELNIYVADICKATLKVNTTTTKEDARKVEAPGFLKVMTMDELMAIMSTDKPVEPAVDSPALEELPAANDSVVIDLNSKTFSTSNQSYVSAPLNIIKEKNVAYFEASLLLEALGHKGAHKGAMEVNGVQYLNADSLKALGFKVTATDSMISISK